MFDGDERDKYSIAFISQLRQALANSGRSDSVQSISAALAEFPSAVRTAKRLV